MATPTPARGIPTWSGCPLSADPSLVDVVQAALAAGLGPVRVAIPAVVVDYDSARQTVTAQVVIRSRYLDADGAAVAYRPRPLAGVPVVFPSGGGASVTWPLVAGDPLVLIVCDRAIDGWKANGGGDQTPIDPRRFDLSDAVALPGGHAPADPLAAGAVDEGAIVLTPPTGGVVKLGGAAASAWVALADLVDARLSALKTYLDTHVHSDPLSGVTGPPSVASPTPATVAATTTKAL